MFFSKEDKGMSINIKQNYNQFYKKTESIKNYGCANSSLKKDTLVQYEFNTTDKEGNKIMDKMTKEETLQVMNDISAQYGDNVIVEFSGDGMAALIENNKKADKQLISEEEMHSIEAKQAAFNKEIVHFDRSADDLPAYSGMFNEDKAIASAVENSSKEEKAYVYNIIRKNFLIKNINSMTEEKRQENISLGMKKAKYAAENFIPKNQKQSFLDAMESIAKLARAGKADSTGNMNYGVKKPSYLGHGSNLVYTTNDLEEMRTRDPKAYEKYQQISKESSNEDRPLNTLKYLLKWSLKSK